MKLSPFKIAFLYLVVGICWIFFSDEAFLYIFHFTNPAEIEHLQSLKGISYVIITAVLLYMLIRHYYRQIRKAAEDYKKIFMNNPLPMWIYDENNYQFLEVNQAVVDKYGYSREEILSMTTLDIRPESEREKFLNLNKGREPAVKDWGIWKHQKKNGELIYVNVFSDHILFKNKQSMLVFALDITEKIKAEELIAVNEKKLNAIINSTDDLIWAINLDLKIIAFNEAFRQVRKAISARDLNVGDAAILNDYDKSVSGQWLNYYERALDGEKFKVEVSDNLPGIGLNYGEITFSPIYNASQKIIGVACFTRNITERKLYEIQLREALENYNLLSKATSDAIWDWDIKSNKVIYNDNFWEKFKYPRSEQGRELREEHLHPEDEERVMAGLKETMEHKQNLWWDEYRFLCGDGTYKHVLDRAYIIYDAAGSPVRIIGAIQDIQQQKEYEAAIEAQNDELREIAWISSHEIRGPVTAVMGLLQLIEDRTTNEQEQEKILSMMKVSLDQLDSVIHKIVNKASQLQN
jgi:PAS domain S-box-containing protein